MSGDRRPKAIGSKVIFATQFEWVSEQWIREKDQLHPQPFFSPRHMFRQGRVA